MNNKVKEQILNIRNSGETNMFDIPKVFLPRINVPELLKLHDRLRIC